MGCIKEHSAPQSAPSRLFYAPAECYEPHSNHWNRSTLLAMEMRNKPPLPKASIRCKAALRLPSAVPIPLAPGGFSGHRLFLQQLPGQRDGTGVSEIGAFSLSILLRKRNLSGKKKKKAPSISMALNFNCFSRVKADLCYPL